jgi:nucleoside-triphosphatase THEP1
MEVAFGMLPQMLGNLPPVKIFAANPVSEIKTMVIQTGLWLEHIRNFEFTPMVIIISGEKGSGKSLLMLEISRMCNQTGFKISGIIQPSLFVDEKHIGYSIMNITSGQTKTLAGLDSGAAANSVGKYYFYEDGLKFGHLALQNTNSEIVFIDEIGPLELSGKGWAQDLKQQLNKSPQIILITIRPSLIKEVILQFEIQNYRIYHLPETTPELVIDCIKSNIEKQKTKF